MARPKASPYRPKNCATCKRSLSRIAFAPNPDRHDGLDDHCRACRGLIEARKARHDEVELVGNSDRILAVRREIELRIAIVASAHRQLHRNLTSRELRDVLPWGRIVEVMP